MPRLAACLAALALASTLAGAARADERAGPVTKKPLPRFESLSAAEAFGRRGPGLDHKIDWVYRRRGLPVQVLQENDVWRRIRDPEGGETWVHASKLSAVQTVYLADAPKEGKALLEAPRLGARPVALMAKGVVGRVTECSSGWRKINVDGHRGWAPAVALWGATECPR